MAAKTKNKTKVPVIGSTYYPCGHGYIKVTEELQEPGTYSRRCKVCKAYWVVHVDPAAMADRFPGLLKLTWGTS